MTALRVVVFALVAVVLVANLTSAWLLSTVAALALVVAVITLVSLDNRRGRR